MASVQRDEVLKRLTHIKTLVDHFWLRWHSEYLLELRNDHRRSQQKSHGVTVNVGDVVVVAEDGVRRGQWRLALVEELVPGRDGLVRGALVKCASTGAALLGCEDRSRNCTRSNLRMFAEIPGLWKADLTNQQSCQRRSHPTQLSRLSVHLEQQRSKLTSIDNN